MTTLANKFNDLFADLILDLNEAETITVNATPLVYNIDRLQVDITSLERYNLT